MSKTNSPERENNKRAKREVGGRHTGHKVDVSILKRFGLSNNDIRVYEALFAIGRTRTGAIIKETGIANSRVYASLQNLINRALASYQVKNNVKYYQAELPSQLIEKSKKDAQKLEALSDALSRLPILHDERNETNTYEGIRGLKMAYQKHYEDVEPHETVLISVSVGDEYSTSQELRSFFTEKIDPIMIKKKVRGHMITNKDVSSIIKQDRPDFSIYSIRYLSPKYKLPYALNISRKEVMISVWGENPIVFCIRNPIVVEAFKKNFEYLWSIAKK
ncbi:MAG TPA: helix-turn-helix domain-containing protein [Candidatus Paceibacterota bacterium]